MEGTLDTKVLADGVYFHTARWEFLDMPQDAAKLQGDAIAVQDNLKSRFWMGLSHSELNAYE